MSRKRISGAKPPRLAFWLKFVIFLLVIINLALIGSSVLFRWEHKQLQTLMTKAEQQRVKELAATQKNQLGLAITLTRQRAKNDKVMHLSIDTKKGVMYLAREGALLREMPVRMGKETLIGTQPDRVRLALPLGKRQVVSIVDSTYAWPVPDWVYKQRGLKPPTTNVLPGTLGPLAIFLDGGTIIYTQSENGPLNDDAYVLPGSVRMLTADVAAIRKELRPGMVVYFY